ncbi:ABC transporter permease [Limnochorda pilosa]|uniref:ABC transporter permease n=1 Tax=Limnochorda pilosa TaxID=1555112 RepID=A0A0K2SN86_LIMPI|nr:ABC transporter permease [Limnochorda pilosa]BAS28575.1 hypothetical protein LIP_2745 [Limnochorda pilosa]
MRAALRRMRQRWFPSLLGVLQVALGTGAVVALLSGLLPTLRATEGPNVFTASYRGVPKSAEGGGGLQGFAIGPFFQAGDANLLRREAPSVARASILASASMVAVEVENQPFLVGAVSAVEPDYFAMLELEPVAGSLFGAAEMEQGAAVAVVSEPVARQIFGGASQAVGQEMKLLSREESGALQGRRSMLAPGQESFPPAAAVRIIGVYQQPAQAAVAIFGLDPQVLVPLGWVETAVGVGGDDGVRNPAEMKHLGPFGGSEGAQLFFTAQPGQELAAQRQVEQILTPLLAQREAQSPRRPGGPELVWRLEIAQGGSSAALRQSLVTSIALLGGMAFVAVVVGGVAVLTASLVNLAYESRAIGLHRALGAGRGRVMRQVLGESMLLAGIGGLAGLVMAWPIQWLIKPLLPGPPFFPELQGLHPLAAVSGLLLAVAVGLLAGLYPGWLASRLQPTEAFREPA